MRTEPGNNINLGEILGHGGQLRLRRDKNGKHQRGRHVFICGSSGVGKSKLLERMIRQDIAKWHDYECGLMLLDPHGAVYDGVMEWLAEGNDLDRPIIPIDLTRDDWIASYNVLRSRKGIDPSVIVRDVVDAMAYVWGQQGTDETPQFAKWATYGLLTLCLTGCTFAQMSQLLNRQDVQRTLAAKLPDGPIRQAWQKAYDHPKEFESQIQSTRGRFVRFETTPALRAMFGQPDVSVDLHAALEKGHIILVNLSTEGGMIQQEDADTFGTLLLSDLWTAARTRKKREGIKPFYVYLDEFQTFVTPAIAKGLDQARGYGLHLTLACQFLNQLLNQGSTGKQLYDSVIANAQNKIVFRTLHPENLQTLAQQLFLGTFDPAAIKDEIRATRVVGYQEAIREDETVGGSVATGGGRSTQSGSGSSEGEGTSITSLMPGSTPEENQLAEWNMSVSKTHGENSSWSESESQHWVRAKSRSVTRRRTLEPILGQEISGRQFRTVEEQQFVAMQQLFVQEDRHCAVKVAGTRAPVFLRTKDIERGRAKPPRVERFLRKQRDKWPFYLSLTEALKRLAAREQKLLDSVYTPSGELDTAKRRIPCTSKRTHSPR